jgi:hypothetical protein
MEPPRTQKEPARQLSPMVWIGIVAAVLVIGFLGSMHYLKGSSKGTNNAATSQSLNGSQMVNTPEGGAATEGEPCPNGQRKAVLNINGEQIVTCGTPANGKVTNVTSDSITIIDNSDGSSKTYAITGDTVIVKKGGVRVKLSDITVGENIGVIPNDDNTAAKRILSDLPS